MGFDQNDEILDSDWDLIHCARSPSVSPLSLCHLLLLISLPPLQVPLISLSLSLFILNCSFSFFEILLSSVFISWINLGFFSAISNSSYFFLKGWPLVYKIKRIQNQKEKLVNTIIGRQKFNTRKGNDPLASFDFLLD